VDITVRAAAEGERFTTLDGEERVLTSDMTVIASGGAPVALAGVMGGLDSEVTDQTVDILLESAAFSPAHTSRTSRNLSLISESSLRYERCVDVARCEDCSAQAAALLAAVCGGTVCSGVVDVYPTPVEPVRLVFRHRRFCDFIGAECPIGDAQRILERLGCEVTDRGDDTLEVVAPTFRPDLTREIDLYEEVLRLWGMEKVTATMPGSRGRVGGRTREQVLVDSIGEALRAQGLNETVTYSLVPEDDLERLRMDPEGPGESVVLLNPMSSEQSVLRRSIIPGLLRSVAHNQNHGVDDVQLYECGKVFAAAEGRKQPRERALVAGILAGSWNPEGWNQPARELDFFDAKGIVENLLRELCVRKVRFRPLEGTQGAHLHPGRAAEVLAGGTVLGWVGEIHPLACEAFGVKGSPVAFELDRHALIASAQDAREFQDIPRFPAVQMDFAIVVDDEVSAERVEQVIRSTGGRHLGEVRLFDVYRDALRLGRGRKSLAFSLSYRDPERTLSAEEVEKQHERLVRKVCAATGGTPRG